MNMCAQNIYSLLWCILYGKENLSEAASKKNVPFSFKMKKIEETFVKQIMNRD